MFTLNTRTESFFFRRELIVSLKVVKEEDKHIYTHKLESYLKCYFILLLFIVRRGASACIVLTAIRAERKIKTPPRY